MNPVKVTSICISARIRYGCRGVHEGSQSPDVGVPRIPTWSHLPGEHGTDPSASQAWSTQGRGVWHGMIINMLQVISKKLVTTSMLLLKRGRPLTGC
jgi:hypothetical protein